MSNSSNIEVDIVLLGRYLSGEATPAEAMAVDDWLTDPGNKKQYQEIERLWNMLPGSSIHQKPELVAAWEQLLHQLPAKKRAPVFKLIVNRYTIAASVIAVMITAVAIFYISQKTPAAQPPQLVVLRSTDTVINDTLPDGSLVVVNKNSSVIFANTFSKTSRELQLTGEAFFNVAHDKAHPFIISVDEIKVQVVGTSFNIHKTGDAAAIEVQVQSGIVKMFNAAKEIMVHKGQTGVYTKHNASFSLKDTIDINSLEYITGTFSFNNVPLADVIEQLKKTFGFTIIADEERLKQCMISARFDNKPLKYILDVISATLNISYTMKGNEIHIHGEGCD